jgi:thiol peroxidase
MKTAVTFKGKLLNLVGRDIGKGKVVSDFKVVNSELEEVKLSNFSEKIKIINSFPSLDTPVCDLQVKEFNQNSVNFSDQVVVLGISKDLPFAQKRFCDSNNIKNVKIFSDYRYNSFGLNYGLLIKELNLVTRAVMILDKNNVLRYLQIVDEIAHQPNYQEVLDELEMVVKEPVQEQKEKLLKCRSCEAGSSSLSLTKIKELIAGLTAWDLIDNKKLKKKYKFQDYSEAKYFMNVIAEIASEQNHHPVLTLGYNVVKVSLTTHVAGGLTDNDFVMAKIIDQVFDKEGQ